MNKKLSSHQRGLAAVLSFFCPGLGQIYKGQIVRGFIYFLTVIGLYATLVLIPIALTLHAFVVFGAYYSYTKRNKVYVDPRRFNRLDDI